jgi:hypothetical protein
MDTPLSLIERVRDPNDSASWRDALEHFDTGSGPPPAITIPGPDHDLKALWLRDDYRRFAFDLPFPTNPFQPSH